MSNTRTTFNPHYLAYVAEFGTTNLHAFNDAGTEALRAALQLEPGQRILDLGCGTGRTVLTFTTKSRVDMIGMDWLEEMLHVARVRLNLARLAPRLVRGDAAAGLPFQAGCYDAVFTESVLSIHSADRVYAMLSEIFRVLKPGGRFVANEGMWKKGTPPEIISRICRSGIEDFGFPPVSDHGWAVKDWITVIHAAGFSVISADLLDMTRNGDSGWSFPEVISRLVTLGFKLKAHLTPRIIRQRRHYEWLLEKHRADYDHLEPRLFVARKPA